MSKFFINHPIPAIVLSIILTLVGTLAALRLPIAEYPDIAPPTVFVSTSYIGALIRIKDFSRVEVGVRNPDSISFQDGHETATFSVLLTNDANTLETISAVKKILAEAEQDFPPDMKCSISMDATRFIKESLSEVSHTFFEALLLDIGFNRGDVCNFPARRLFNQHVDAFRTDFGNRLGR